MKRHSSSIIVGTITAVVLLLTTVSPATAQKKAFTIDDLYSLKSISDLNLSADGKQLLYTIRSYDFKKGKSFSDIYIMNTAGGESRQLTFDVNADYHPFWSRDGKAVYFLSSRKEGEQLWKLSLSGGEAQQVSKFYSGVSSPQETGLNGTPGFYFTSTVYAECMADGECNKAYDDKAADGPVQAHMADNLLFRHWTSYRDWTYSHLFHLDTASGKISAVTDGKQDYPSFNLGGGDGYHVSADGRTLCIVANHDQNQAHSTNSDLFLADLSAKEFKLRNITAHNKAYDGEPMFSPDGKFLAYSTHRAPGYESDKLRLALYNINTAEQVLLTDQFDYNIDTFQWSHDSRYIYFTMQEKGYTPLYRINVTDRKVEQMLEGCVLHEFIPTPDNKGIIGTRSTVGQPVEIYSYQFSKNKKTKTAKTGTPLLRQLSRINQTVADRTDIRPAESHWVDGADGKKIHVFIVKPHDFDPAKKYPLILNIHGGPQMQWMDSFRADWQVYPGAGYIVAFPNPHGSTGYGQAFTEAISNDWSGRVMQDVDNVSDYLAALPYVDAQRMGAMGWSWGGYAVMWLEGHNKHFKALASMMGIYNTRTFYSSTEELWFPNKDLGGKPWENTEAYKVNNPADYVKNFKTPCLIITGERDYRVPYNLSIEFFTDLQEMNVPSRLIIFKHDGHWPGNATSMPVYYNAHLEWFHHYLKGGKAPYDTQLMIRNRAYDTEKK